MSTSNTANQGPANPANQDLTLKLIANERLKITASLLNNCSMATLGSGVIVPSAALAYETTIPQSPYYFVVAAGWFVVGVLIHFFTRWTLRGLKA